MTETETETKRRFALKRLDTGEYAVRERMRTAPSAFTYAAYTYALYWSRDLERADIRLAFSARDSALQFNTDYPEEFRLNTRAVEVRLQEYRP